MAIRVEIVPAVKTLAALVKSLIGAKQPRDVQERAQQALEQANPHLAGAEGVKPGIAIVVPDLGAPTVAEENAGTPAQAGAETLLAAVGSRLDASLAEAKEEARTLGLKKTRDALLAANPELTAEQLDAIAGEAQEEAAHTAAVVEQFRKGLEDAMTRLPRR